LKKLFKEVCKTIFLSSRIYYMEKVLIPTLST